MGRLWSFFCDCGKVSWPCSTYCPTLMDRRKHRYQCPNMCVIPIWSIYLMWRMQYANKYLKLYIYIHLSLVLGTGTNSWTGSAGATSGCGIWQSLPSQEHLHLWWCTKRTSNQGPWEGYAHSVTLTLYILLKSFHSSSIFASSHLFYGLILSLKM